MTPEGGLYWENIRPTKQEFKFDYPDRVLAFADANGIEMRGHTLVWYGAMPDWTKQIRGAAEAERELQRALQLDPNSSLARRTLHEMKKARR